MRHNDRVRLGMGKSEGAAEHVAELVMQRHAGRRQARAAEPGAVKRLGARLAIPGLGDDLRQRAREGARAFLRHQ